jgi:putative transposase
MMDVPHGRQQMGRLLAYVTGLVNQKLVLQNENLAAENRILRAHLPAPMRLSDPQRSTLAEIGKRLGRSALQQVACVAKPDTILARYRRLIARKFNGSEFRTSPGRPRVATEVEALIVRFARENSGWGYDRIVGALADLGHVISHQTVGNILRRYGIQPALRRSQSTTWKDFVGAHLAILAGTDFFPVEVLSPAVMCPRRPANGSLTRQENGGQSGTPGRRRLRSNFLDRRSHLLICPGCGASVRGRQTLPW